MGLFGPPDVDRLRARRDIRGLIRALRHYDWTRPRDCPAGRALGALVSIGAAAVGPLCEALSSPDDNMCRLAAEALGSIGDQRAVLPLCAALGGPARHAAARALGQIRDPRAVEPLCRALRETSSAFGNSAAEALAQIGDRRAVEPLCAALQDAGMKGREAIAQALGRIRDATAVGPLCNALQDREVRVASAAAEALGCLNDPRAVEPLCAAIGHTEARVREAAAKALAALYHQGALDEAARRRILALQETLAGLHEDWWGECGLHADRAIGVVL